MNEMIRILLWCPNALTVELLTGAFARNSTKHRVANLASPEDVDALEPGSIDIALVSCDLSVKECDGFKILRRVRERSPQTKAIVLFEKPEKEAVLKAFRFGAKGVFSIRDCEFGMLCRCVDCVHSGQIWATGEELGWVLEDFEVSSLRPANLRLVTAAGVNLLSRREEDLVRLLMEGLSNREIADTLKLSPHTVKNYLFRIFDKLGVSSRTELLVYSMGSMERTRYSSDSPSRIPAERQKDTAKRAAAAGVPEPASRKGIAAR